MVLAHENKCAMCGKEATVREEHDINKNDKEQKQQEKASPINVEQIDGTYYTFDTADCVLMFKKFSAVYGSNFAD
jgi:uncharacterized Zn finger protein (UPF0148 family)